MSKGFTLEQVALMPDEIRTGWYIAAGEIETGQKFDWLSGTFRDEEA